MGETFEKRMVAVSGNFRKVAIEHINFKTGLIKRGLEVMQRPSIQRLGHRKRVK